MFSDQHIDLTGTRTDPPGDRAHQPMAMQGSPAGPSPVAEAISQLCGWVAGPVFVLSIALLFVGDFGLWPWVGLAAGVALAAIEVALMARGRSVNEAIGFVIDRHKRAGREGGDGGGWFDGGDGDGGD